MARVFDEDNRIWENVTYYANWYNPTEYNIYLNNLTLTAYAGDYILPMLQETETEGYTYDYYFDNVLITEHTYMPNRSISIHYKNKRGKQYAAYFDANGGNFDIEKIVFTFGTEFRLPSQIPAASNVDKAFDSWELDDTNYYPDDDVPTQNHDLYFRAKWIDKFVFTAVLGGYEFSKFNDKSATSLVIPSTYNGLPVISIGDYAFSGCNKLTNIIIPNGVKYIGYGAFSRCSELTSVTIPVSVISIGSNTFYYYDKFTNIKYNGTMKQWRAISKIPILMCNNGLNSWTVYCTDGNLDLYNEHEI